MDTITIIALTVGALVAVVMSWLGGYEVGIQNGTSAERERSNHRARGILAGERERDIKAALDDELARLERERDEAREDAKEAKRLILQYKQLLHDWSKEATK